MSRLPLVAGNWKMNKTVPESLDLVAAIGAGAPGQSGEVEVVLLPPFTSLWPVAERLGDSGIVLGVQDIYWEAAGAFTGEVSPVMVAGWCRYALIGHSERRRLFGETDETVNRKVHAALAHGLRPMVAVGESLEENEAGETEAVSAWWPTSSWQSCARPRPRKPPRSSVGSGHRPLRYGERVPPPEDAPVAPPEVIGASLFLGLVAVVSISTHGSYLIAFVLGRQSFDVFALI